MIKPFNALSPQVRQYLVVTGNYWAFTLTDGALRMLVVLHFHQLGYSPLEVAMLFIFYELFGVITNLIGGWIGAYLGLNATMNAGLAIQVIALSLLLVPEPWLTVGLVMTAQALSGIAKDLNKMSAKSAIRLLVPKDAKGVLFHWVAMLTGSKNALKGIGFFLGGALLAAFGFRSAIAIMASALALVWLFSMIALRKNLGKSSTKPKFNQLLSKSRAINCLSAARLFLFAARDVWFVVALPVYLSSTLGWNNWAVGTFLASWVIGYGIIQSITPKLIGENTLLGPDKTLLFRWAAWLSLAPLGIVAAMSVGADIEISLVVGLFVFGAIFAVNSALHSFLIISYANEDGVSLDVGFYYMANAMGRLLGTLLSGWVFQSWGFTYCLWISSLLIAISAGVSLMLPTDRSDKERLIQ
ncbi:MAG: putative MFS family arabinose efflux permease [Oceanicoccus sp.]|jgi:predicted MFS family arabinose efflux permease